MSRAAGRTPPHELGMACVRPRRGVLQGCGVLQGRGVARQGAERGSILPIVPIIALVMLMLAGLVIDASRQLNARGQAVAYAEEAARAGAQGILRELPVALDPAEAGDLVAEYCATVLSQPHVTSCDLTRLEPAPEGPPRPLVVVVQVRTEIPTTLLNMVGVQSLSAFGEGRAQPVEGVLDVPEPTPEP